MSSVQQPSLNLFEHLITLKFSDISWESQLTLKHAKLLKIGEQLNSQKKKILMMVLFNRKVTMTWHFSHIRRFWSGVAPLQKIQIIDHETWQMLRFHMSKVLESEIIKMLKERLNYSIMKQCYESYWNSWILVQKSQKKKYQLINAVIHINQVTTQDANVFFNNKQFTKEFKELKAVSLVNLQLEYDQIALNKMSRNLTDFLTSLKLLQNCIIQNSTNLIAQFC